MLARENYCGTSVVDTVIMDSETFVCEGGSGLNQLKMEARILYWQQWIFKF
jgi:hypothetical protein